MRLLFQDPFVADEPVLHLACSRALEGRTAVYLHRMAVKPVDPRAADEGAGRELWARSEEVLAAAAARSCRPPTISAASRSHCS